MHECKGVFNPNIPIFASNSAEGLHFSAFHFILFFNLISLVMHYSSSLQTMHAVIIEKYNHCIVQLAHINTACAVIN